MAREFDSSLTQYLTADSGAAVVMAPATVVAWIKPTTAQLASVFQCSSSDDEDQAIELGIYGSDSEYVPFLRIQKDDVAGIAKGTTTATVNEWTMITGILNSDGNREMWINDIKDAINIGELVPTNLDQTIIGSGFDGSISHVATWNEALTRPEIEALWMGWLPYQIRPAALTHFWPLWGIHDPEIDLVENPISLELVNDPARAETDAALKIIFPPVFETLTASPSKLSFAATTDMTRIFGHEVEQSSTVSYPYPIWAGQSAVLPMRIVNKHFQDRIITISASGEHSDRLSFSLRKNVSFGETVTTNARADGMTDTIYVRIDIPNNAKTEVVEGGITIEWDDAS